MFLRGLSICLLVAALAVLSRDALYSPVGSPALEATTIVELLPVWLTLGVLGLGLYALSRTQRTIGDRASTAATHSAWRLTGLLVICGGLFVLVVELLPDLAVGAAPTNVTFADLWAHSQPASFQQLMVSVQANPDGWAPIAFALLRLPDFLAITLVGFLLFFFGNVGAQTSGRMTTTVADAKPASPSPPKLPPSACHELIARSLATDTTKT